jgi:hypothetical protein
MSSTLDKCADVSAAMGQKAFASEKWLDKITG